MADLVIRPEDIIDGIKLDVNRIGYINYETLANKPDLSQYITIGNTYGKLNNKSVGFLIDNNYQLIAYSARISGDFEGNATINAGTIGGCQITNGKLRVPFLQIDNIPDYIEKGIIYGSVNDGQTGILINTNGKLKARDADVNGALGGTFNGEVTATKFILNGIKIPISDISNLNEALSKCLKNDTNYGIIDDKNMPGFSISTLGKLKATNAYIRGDLGGTFSGAITNSTITNCQIDNSTLNGEKGIIDLANGTLNLGLDKFIFTNNPDENNGVIFKVKPSGSDTSLFWLDNINSLHLMNIIDRNNFETSISPTSFTVSDEANTSSLTSNAITFTNTNTCSITFDGRNIKLDNPVFLDYYERAQSGSNKNWRRPIASVGSDGLNIGYMKAKTSSGGTKQVAIKGQWGTEDLNGTPTSNQGVWDDKLQYINIDSTSDIRLKENIEDSSVTALPIVMNMRIRQFNWKETNNHQPLGLVADEIEKFDPLLTIGGGYDADGSINIKSINRLLLTEYAIKAIQEQQIIIDRQQKEINALKDALKTK